jgi:hypothetical protein
MIIFVKTRDKIYCTEENDRGEGGWGEGAKKDKKGKK